MGVFGIQTFAVPFLHKSGNSLADLGYAGLGSRRQLHRGGLVESGSENILFKVGLVDSAVVVLVGISGVLVYIR